ncbi:MAG: hypothetical protein M1820_001822 [Bogoriella megaspora]|nr:MAG: hypothetical protein M1820_001822 [Bogoriella megaspora]
MEKVISKAKDALHKDQNPDQTPLTPSQEPSQKSQEGSNSEMNSEAEAALNAHNAARKKKNLELLQWSSDLAAEAEAWAKHLAKKGLMEHSGVGGENLFWASQEQDSEFETAARAWLSEEKNYHGGAIGEGNFATFGHFTQCMWHSTKHLGMGKANGKRGFFVVARYDPKGNMSGEKPYGN